MDKTTEAMTPVEALSLFKPENIRERRDLAVAMKGLERSIEETGANMNEILAAICDFPGIFELAISGLGQSASERLAQVLSRKLVACDLSKYRTSLPRRIMQRLATFFSTLSAFPNEQVESRCRKACDSIRDVHAALDAIHIAVGEVTASSRNARAGIQKPISIDASLFEQLRVESPKTVRDVQGSVDALFEILRARLNFFLQLLRENEDIIELVQNEIYQRNWPSQVAGEGSDQITDEIPNTLPQKSFALMMDNADGFGNQRILLSSRAVRDLRNARGKPDLFSSVVEVLRALSRGQMDEKAVKVLAETYLIKISSVKASRSCSIVYFVDQVPSLQHEVTESAIRVFGIYTTSSIQNNFWITFAAAISARRAAAETPHTHIKEPVTLSAPRARKSIQHIDEMRSLLVINKFVDLSQNALHAIQHNEDISQAFELSQQEQKLVDFTGSCYVLGRSGSGKTTVIVTKILATECTFAKYPEMMQAKPRQLFVTRSQPLAAKVKDTYENMYRAHVLGRNTEDSSLRRHTLVDSEEEVGHSQETRRWGNLTDDDFPLFISFDRLCSLVEEELEFVRPSWSRLPHEARISYEIFLGQYWPVLESSALRGADPALVFGQFIGVIQGSAGSLKSSDGFISQDEYVSLSRPMAITRLQERRQIYDLFVSYKKLKTLRREHDIADRTHSILRGMANAPSLFHGTVDFLFVDEAQDNLLIDTRLLRLLCSNPNGLFWAGDTAQTVFAGSAFTFNQLKQFMWDTEHELLPEQGISKSPEFFPLTVNFRSQHGILACAESVLDCLATFWPTSIDKVLKEQGVSGGKCPILFIRQSGDGHLLAQLFKKANSVEFGADQCIIVRDSNARAEAVAALEDTVRISPQILTLYESKGLEFKDVLLYNFFGDSHCDSTQWRHLHRLVTSGSSANMPASAKFDAIIRELKSLYVGCTRAKNTLWIIETSLNAAPIQHIWKQREEIDCHDVEPDLSQFASASDKRMWERKAQEYFDRSYFSLARQAYLNAGLSHEAKIATAYLLRDSAVNIGATSPDSARSKAFDDAAHAFNEVASATAGPERHSYYRIAAKCFLKVPEERSAAVAFENACMHNQAIELYRAIGDLPKTIQLLRDHDTLRPETVDKVQYAARLFCLLNSRIIDAISIFPQEEDVLVFVSRHGLDRAEFMLLEHIGANLEAVQRRIEADQLVSASSLLKQLRTSGSMNTFLPLNDLHAACWRHMSISTIDWKDTVPPITRKMEALLYLTSHLHSARPIMNGKVVDIAVFRAIALSDRTALHRLRSSEGSENKFTSLLCLSRLISPPQEYSHRSIEDIFQWLQAFLPMCRLLHDLCLEKDPSHSSAIQHILGFRCVTPTNFRLLPDSAILRYAISKKTPAIESDKAVGPLISRDTLQNLLRSCLLGALQRRVDEAVSTLRPALMTRVTGSGPISLAPILGSLLRMALILDDTYQLSYSKSSRLDRSQILDDVHFALTSVTNDPRHVSVNTVLGTDESRDARLGIRVVQTWIRHSLKTMPKTAMTSLLKLFTISHALCSVPGRHPHKVDDSQARLATNAALDTAVAHCVDMYTGSKPWSFDVLLSLLRCVVEKGVVVDLTVLCTTIEITAGFLALLYSEYARGTLSGTVLLKRCLLSYGIDGIETYTSCPSYQQCKSLVTTAYNLLQKIIGSSVYPSAPGISENSWGLKRTDCVRRLIETMIILGHNIPDSSLRDYILAAIESLCMHPMEQELEWVCEDYFAAGRNWAELTAALADTQHLVKLAHITEYFSGRDRYIAMQINTPLVDRCSTDPMLPVDTDLLRRESLQTTWLDLHSEIHTESWFETRLENQALAVMSLQTLFRKKQARQRLERISCVGPTSFLMRSAFEECMQEVDRISWRSLRHRHVFLGIVPHILVCLDVMQMHFEQMKIQAVRRLKEAPHRDLEKLGQAVTTLDDYLREVKYLRVNRLGPKSGLYRIQLWKSFRDAFGDVQKLMEKLPRNALHADWAIVDRHVLQGGSNALMWS